MENNSILPEKWFFYICGTWVGFVLGDVLYNHISFWEMILKIFVGIMIVFLLNFSISFIIAIIDSFREEKDE